MEIFIAIIIISVILFLLIKGGQSLESRDVTKMLDAELIKYKSQFEQRARLSIKAGDNINVSTSEDGKTVTVSATAEPTVLEAGSGITVEKTEEEASKISYVPIVGTILYYTDDTDPNSTYSGTTWLKLEDQ